MLPGSSTRAAQAHVSPQPMSSGGVGPNSRIGRNGKHTKTASTSRMHECSLSRRLGSLPLLVHAGAAVHHPPIRLRPQHAEKSQWKRAPTARAGLLIRRGICARRCGLNTCGLNTCCVGGLRVRPMRRNDDASGTRHNRAPAHLCWRCCQLLAGAQSGIQRLAATGLVPVWHLSVS